MKRIFRSGDDNPEIPQGVQCGKGTKYTGSVSKKSGSTIRIGDACLIEGTLTTYLPDASILIGNNVFIGKNTLIGCGKSIEIGDDVLISFDVIIQDSDTHSLSSVHRKKDTTDWMNGTKDWTHVTLKPVKIGDKAWIGARAIILKGIQIGQGAIVGAGSVVTSDVEPFTIVAGNPARFIRKTD